MDYENGLISTVLQTGEMGMAIERRVTPVFFLDDQHRMVWRAMVAHFNTYGTAPTTDVVLASFPSYDIEDYPHPPAFYVDALADRRKHAIILNAVQESADTFSDYEGPEKTDKIEEGLRAALLQANIETEPAKHLSYAEALLQRLPEWMAGIGIHGISYGLPTLDNLTGGIRPEQFIVLTGLAKARKTWTLLHVASSVHAMGYPVVFLTFEMSNDEQLERLGTLWAKVPFAVMRDKSLLTRRHARQIKRYLHSRQQLPQFLGVEDAAGHSTVSSIQALIKETQPAAVFIDGVYFMTDEITGESGSASSQALTNISRALKRLAKTEKVAVMVTTQTLSGKVTKNRTSLFGMGYTSAFSQDGDVIIGVESTEDRPDIAVMRILGNRSGPQGVEFHVTWDLDTGQVEEVGISDESLADYDDIDS